MIVSIAFFMQQLDGTVIATALPQMAKTFNDTPLDVSIGVTAYLLTLAVFIPSSSWVADRFGARTIFASAIIVFTIGSILCGFSNTLPEFAASRIIQAIGGAMMLPVGRLAVLRSAEKHELIRVMQYITVPGLIAPVLGPPLGGFITTYFNWRWIFFLNIPIGIIGVVLVFIFMQNFRPAERRPFDMLGFLLSGVGLASVMYGITLLGHENAPPLETIAFLAVGIVVVLLALRHARTHAAPLVDLTPIGVPTFWVSVLGGGALYRMIIGATPFMWPLMFQIGFGMSAFAAGSILMACTAGDLAGQGFVRQVLRRYGFRKIMVGSSIATTVFVFACVLFTQSTPVVALVIVLAAIGVLRSLEFTAMNSLSYSDIAPEHMSAASTLASTLQQMTFGIGVAFGAIALNGAALLRGEHGGALTAGDFQLGFIAVGVLGILATLNFMRLPRDAGAHMTRKPAGA